MQIEYPEHILNIREIAYIFAQEEKVGPALEEAARNVEDDIHITTARETGIARREKILGINPLDTESLEDRRFRVLGKWYDFYPYTYPDLIRRLNNLLGADGYTIALDYELEVLTVRVELTRRSMMLSVIEILEKIVPLNVIIDIDLRYAQHKDVNGITHGHLSETTHEGIRFKEFM